MDWGLIQGAATGLKAGIDLHKAIQDGKVQIESQGVVLEALGKLSDVQTALLALQAELFRLQAENQELRDKASSKAEWEQKLAGYDLVQTDGGAYVHRSKAEPTHYICPTCINKRELHILQDNRTLSGKYRCTGCQAEFPVNPQKKHEWQPLPRGGGWQG